MHRSNIIKYALAILFLLFSLALLFAGFLPFQVLKPLADSLVSDGNFTSITTNNVIVFKAWLVGFGLFSAIVGVIIAAGFIPWIIRGLRHYYLDLRVFLLDLKPKKVGLLSLILALLVLACAAVVRLQRLNDVITHDEAYTYVVFSSTSLFNIVTNYHLPNNHVLNSLLIYLSTHLLGGQPWVVRLPAFLAGLASILAVYVLARQLYDKPTALLSSILVAALPGAIFYSTRGRGYVLVSLFTLISLLLANSIRKKDNLFAWSLLVVCVALGFYSVPVMLFPFAIIFTWLLCENLFDTSKPTPVKVRFLRNWLCTSVLTALVVLLLYTPIFIYSGIRSVFANPFVQSRPWQGYVASIPSKAAIVWQSWIDGFPPTLAILLLIGFALGLVLQRKIARNRFPLQLAAFLAIFLTVLVQRPAGETKIWSFLQAPFMMWCAAGIVGVIKLIRIKSTQKTFLISIPAAIGLILLLVMSVKTLPTIRSAWLAKGPVEKTAAAIHDQISAEDLIIVDAPFDAPIWYYAKLDGLGESYFAVSSPFDRLFVIVSPSDGQTLDSVLQSRGPTVELYNSDEAETLLSIGFLDTYIVPHR